MKHIGINLCEVGPIDCDTNADGGYDCECDTRNCTNIIVVLKMGSTVKVRV